MAQNFDTAWKEIEKLQNEGKYRSALEKSEVLYQLAADDGAVDQQLRALFHRVAFTQQLEEDGAAAALALLQKTLSERAENPWPAFQAVNHYALGRMLLGQLENYNRRPSPTSSEAEDPELPIAEWSNERLVNTGSKHLLQALEVAKKAQTELKSIPAIVRYDKSTAFQAPTLHELLVYEVLSALNDGYAYLSEPVYAFRPTAQQLFAPAANFIGTQIDTRDTSGLHYRSMRIYQNLLASHPTNSPTFIYANLQRLEWAFQQLRDEQAFYQALQSDQPKGGDARWMLRQVSLLQSYPSLGATKADGSLDEEAKRLHLIRCRKLANDLIQQFPNSYAANQAAQIIQQLELPNLQLQAEEVVVPNEPILLQLNYRNAEKFHYRLVRLAYDLPERANRYNNEEEEAWTKLAPLHKGSLSLSKNDDLQSHTSEFNLKGLAPGRYGLLVSTHESFDDKKGSVASLSFVVSQMALVKYKKATQYTGLVLDRQVGSAVLGVKATFYKQTGSYDKPKWKSFGESSSNQSGYLDFQYDGYNTAVVLEKGEDKLIINYNQYRDYTNDRESRQTHIFLDRGIYRPGQTVYFKGLATLLDPQGRPTLLKDEAQEVRLLDVNGQEVSKADFTTDDFGAFDGQFTLPATGLNGLYRIEVSGAGSRSFRVEAYKRPRFEVVFEPNDEPIEAGDTVTVQGKALGFAGPAVAGAVVTYRVERKMPSYYRWWWSGSDSPDAILASGTTLTDEAGVFTLQFPALLPSGQTSQGKGYFRPAYQFVIHVDVADVTGETHAASTNRQLRPKGNLMTIESPSLLDAAQAEAWSLDIRFQGEADEKTKHQVQISLEAVAHPDPALIGRKWSFPDRPILKKTDFKQLFPHLAYAELADIGEWAGEGKMLIDRSLRTAGDTSLQLDASQLATGHYRLKVTYLSEGGEDQVIDRHIRVLNTETAALPSGMLHHLENLSGTKVLPGEEVRLLHLCQNQQALVLHQWHSRAGKKEGQGPADKKQSYTYPSTDADRGGLQFSQRFVAYNRVFEQQISFAVPWPTKALDITLATFRDKLRPGEAEEWTMKISQHDGSPANAQVLASMYDAALDQLTPFVWNLNAFPNSFYAYEPFTAFQFGNTQGYGRYDYKPIPYKEAPAAPRLLTEPMSFSYYGGGMLNELVITGRGAPRRAMRAEAMMSAAPPSAAPPAPYDAVMAKSETIGDIASDSMAEAEEAPAEAPVNIRTNLQETAFWYPKLRTEEDGTLALSFTSPEALSRWKFQLLAHTPDLAYAAASREVVTQKELIITPNAPRFLREGDRIVFTAKVSNLSEESLIGTAQLELFDPVSLATYPIDKAANGSFALQALGDGASGQPANQMAFALEAGGSEGLRWEITVPLGAAGELGYRVIARSKKFSDGEQNVLPVLSNRIFLTATKPFFLRSGQQKTVILEALAKAGNTQGQLEHKGFSFELTNDPSWLVVKSLPYLMEYPYDCTEQLANRFFANQLSYTIVDQNPAFRAVFEAWKQDPDALKSPLALNQDLKQALLEETPWLREAANESEQKERLAVLFDVAKLADELETTLAKLENRQSSDGSYAWFPDGPRNRYMTQYVAETMTRLHKLKALEGSKATRVQQLTTKTLGYLDFEVGKEYLQLQKNLDKKALEDYLPSSLLLHYLYIRSAEISKATQLEGDARKAVDYYLGQAKKQWTKYGLHEQALLAIIFANTKDKTGERIIESLRERAIRSEELGMSWKYPRGFYWQQLPVETHSRLIEAFSCHQFQAGELDEMRLYLLQNKRTNRWETTKATAAAAYAFLQTEGGWLQETPGQQKVRVKFPDLPKSSYVAALEAAESTAEAGTGYYRAQWAGEAVSEQFAKVELNNKKGSVAWGGLYWQFMQDIDAVEAANESPMTLKRRLFRRITTEEGQKLEAISSSKPMRPGERLVVQLVIQTDRDMEYIHLKDRRAAGLEPSTQLSQYRYEGGLGFYFSPDDLAVHYFIDYLPRGTYTLEYDLFVNHAGDFSNGLSVLQSMYAPEFSAYSDGSRLQVE